MDGWTIWLKIKIVYFARAFASVVWDWRKLIIIYSRSKLSRSHCVHERYIFPRFLNWR